MRFLASLGNFFYYCVQYVCVVRAMIVYDLNNKNDLMVALVGSTYSTASMASRRTVEIKPIEQQ